MSAGWSRPRTADQHPGWPGPSRSRLCPAPSRCASMKEGTCGVPQAPTCGGQIGTDPQVLWTGVSSVTQMRLLTQLQKCPRHLIPSGDASAFIHRLFTGARKLWMLPGRPSETPGIDCPRQATILVRFPAGALLAGNGRQSAGKGQRLAAWAERHAPGDPGTRLPPYLAPDPPSVPGRIGSKSSGWPMMAAAIPRLRAAKVKRTGRRSIPPAARAAALGCCQECRAKFTGVRDIDLRGRGDYREPAGLPDWEVPLGHAVHHHDRRPGPRLEAVPVPVSSVPGPDELAPHSMVRRPLQYRAAMAAPGPGCRAAWTAVRRVEAPARWSTREREWR